MNWWYEKLMKKSLIKTIVKSFGFEYLVLIMWTLLTSILDYASPFLVYKIINWIQSDDKSIFNGLKLMTFLVGTQGVSYFIS
jgi:ABC-type multidrug transport system fused ATPase/permease subunit